MAMTKKDFVAVAAALQKARGMTDEQEFARVVGFLCYTFYEINNSFNIHTFMKAVGLNHEQQATTMAMYRLMGGN